MEQSRVPFRGATLTSKTRLLPEADLVTQCVLVNAKTDPEHVAPGTAPKLLVTFRHGADVRLSRLHIEVNGATQELEAKMEQAPTPGAAKPGAGTFESTLTVDFPSLAKGTLVRYWIESTGPGAEPQRLPAKDAPTPNFSFYVQDMPQGSKLPFYELIMDPRDLMALENNPWPNNTRPAIFVADGEVYDRVKVRFRGQWARSWPKKPIKIFFNRDKPLEGHHSLNLNSGWRDPAFIRETLAYHVYAVSGVPAPVSRMTRLHVNGAFRGLYVEVEQPDKAFRKRMKLKNVSLFKTITKSNQADERDLGAAERYAAHYERESQKAVGFGELHRFCGALARATNTLAFFTQNVDLDKYINYLAATALVQHWDCYNKNHLLAHDGSSQKWFVVPWDLDRTFGDHWNWSFDYAELPALLGTRQLPGVTGWNRLQDRFFSDPTLRSKFLDRLQELLEKEFTTSKLFPFLDRLESGIAPEAAQDRRLWPSPAGDLHRGIAGVKGYIERRRAFLLDDVKKLRREPVR